MVKIAGYVKQREPKWPYFVIIVLIALLFFGGLFSVSLLREWWHGWLRSRPSPTEIKPPPPAAPLVTPEAAAVGASATTVEVLALTSAITEDNRPADDLTAVAIKETPTVYCYTRVSSRDLPDKITHVWLAPGGQTIAEIKLDVSSRPSVSWSYINISGQRVGQWQVRVEAEDGTVLAKKDFTTY
jgi:hypothetical protein